MIENNHRNLPTCGSEAQPELFLYRREYGWRYGVASLITVQNELEIELAFELCVIFNSPVELAAQSDG